MSTTAITIQSQVTDLQRDIKTSLEQFFASLPDMESNIAMSTALVEQSKAITVRDAEGYVAATEHVSTLKTVGDEIAELMDPFIKRLYEAHRTATAIRKRYLEPIDGEVKRLKREREDFAAEEERRRREAAQKAQEEARQREEARLVEEARQAAAEGNTAEAEAILEAATTVEAPAVILPSTVPVVEGTSFRTVWEWAIEDATKLKAEFIQPKEKEIGALVRSMHKAAESVVGSGAIRVWDRKIIVG